MADKWTALHTFFNSFGITAYDENTVPEEASFPYMTYEAAISDFDNFKVPITASLWYLSNSWEGVSQKAEEISNAIGGGYGVRYTGGRLWITKENPFAQRMGEPSNEMVRRIVLQLGAEFQ